MRVFMWGEADVLHGSIFFLEYLKGAYERGGMAVYEGG